MKRQFYHIIGGKTKKGMRTITSTTFDNSIPVKIYFPKKVTPNIRKNVRNFMLNELDSYLDYDRFQRMTLSKRKYEKYKNRL